MPTAPWLCKLGFAWIAATLLLASLTRLSLAASSSSLGQSCHLRELDLCAASLLALVQNPSGLATSEPELARQCVHLREADSCVSNYTRHCMTPLQRELVSFATNSSVAGIVGEFCNSPKGALRTNYLKHAPCLNSIHKSGAAKACVRDMQAALELLTAPGEHGKRLQLGCCTYRKFESCLGAQIEKRCGKETQAFVAGAFRRLSSRLPEVVCRNYRPESQECRALLPPSGKPVKGTKATSVVSRLFAAYASL